MQKKSFYTYLLLLFAMSLLVMGGCATQQNIPLEEKSSGESGNTKVVKKTSSEESPFWPEDEQQENSSEDTYVPDVPRHVNLEKKEFHSAQEYIDAALDYCQEANRLWNLGETDKALDTLDLAYSYILKVDEEQSPDLIQQKEDLRILIAKRINEIYASLHTAAKGNHNAIPMIMNSHVEDEIRRFQGVERDFFINSYRRSGRYRPAIVAALKAAGLPEELSWLPLIESGFKCTALSRARALGLWQFIPSTGYKFGLNRDAWIDERLDPEKSTQAAIAYLKELHDIFGDWTTVLAAYNCGEGRVLRLIRGQKVNYLDNFWDLYPMLPRETARYVPRFLATLHIIKDPERYGMYLPEPDSPLTFETVIVDKQMSLNAIAQAIGVSVSTLVELNPELRYKVTPNKPYELKVPVGYSSTLLASIDSIPTWCPPKRKYKRYNKKYAYHRVRRGETLSFLARKYRTSVSAIKRANRIRSAKIRVGQLLKIPVGKSRHKNVCYTKKAKRRIVKYVVKRGDSLWMIARKFNTTAKAIMRYNGLRSIHLKVGQVLKIPVKRYSQRNGVLFVKARA